MHINNTPKILLVEDNRVAQLVAKLNLEQLHCTVDIADNGNRALQLANQNKYDLILMDLDLGEMSGYTLTKQIRSENNHNTKIPIVALTAHSKESVEEQSIQSGINDIVIKPLTSMLAKELIQKFFPQDIPS